MDWGVHIQGLGYGGKIGGIQQYIWGKQVIIMGRALGSWRVYLGGWGTYHGRVLGHLRGPTLWNLPTLRVGIFSRGGGDGGGRTLPPPLPDHVDRPPGLLSLF